MYQLRSLINRSSVPSDPSNNMNSSEDFLQLLLHAHSLVAAQTVQAFNPTNSVTELASQIVASYVNLPMASAQMTMMMMMMNPKLKMEYTYMLQNF